MFYCSREFLSSSLMYKRDRCVMSQYLILFVPDPSHLCFQQGMGGELVELLARQIWAIPDISHLALGFFTPLPLLPSGLPSCQVITTCSVAKDLMDSFYHYPSGPMHVAPHSVMLFFD